MHVDLHNIEAGRGPDCGEVQLRMRIREAVRPRSAYEIHEDSCRCMTSGPPVTTSPLLLRPLCSLSQAELQPREKILAEHRARKKVKVKTERKCKPIPEKVAVCKKLACMQKPAMSTPPLADARLMRIQEGQAEQEQLRTLEKILQDPCSKAQYENEVKQRGIAPWGQGHVDSRGGFLIRRGEVVMDHHYRRLIEEIEGTDGVCIEVTEVLRSEKKKPSGGRHKVAN